MDISRDDGGYLYILQHIHDYGQRDWGWFGAANIIGLGGGYREVLVMTSAVLLAKFYVIDKIFSQKIAAGFFYVTVFWQLHDLTQLRLSVGMFFVLLFLWKKMQDDNYAWAWLLVGSLFHIQILVLFFFDLIFVRLVKSGKRLHRVYFFVFIFVAVMGLFGIWLDVYGLVQSLKSIVRIDSVLFHLVDSYNTLTEVKGGAVGLPLMFLVVQFVGVFLFYFDGVDRRFDDDKYSYLFIGLMFSVVVSYAFALLEDVMVRLYEMYWVFLLVYVGVYARVLSSLLVVFVGFLYFTKLNLIWRIMGW